MTNRFRHWKRDRMIAKLARMSEAKRKAVLDDLPAAARKQVELLLLERAEAKQAATQPTDEAPLEPAPPPLPRAYQKLVERSDQLTPATRAALFAALDEHRAAPEAQSDFGSIWGKMFAKSPEKGPRA